MNMVVDDIFAGAWVPPTIDFGTVGLDATSILSAQVQISGGAQPYNIVSIVFLSGAPAGATLPQSTTDVTGDTIRFRTLATTPTGAVSGTIQATIQDANLQTITVDLPWQAVVAELGLAPELSPYGRLSASTGVLTYIPLDDDDAVVPRIARDIGIANANGVRMGSEFVLDDSDTPGGAGMHALRFTLDGSNDQSSCILLPYRFARGGDGEDNVDAGGMGIWFKIHANSIASNLYLWSGTRTFSSSASEGARILILTDGRVQWGTRSDSDNTAERITSDNAVVNFNAWNWMYVRHATDLSAYALYMNGVHITDITLTGDADAWIDDWDWNVNMDTWTLGTQRFGQVGTGTTDFRNQSNWDECDISLSSFQIWGRRQPSVAQIATLYTHGITP